MVFGHSSIIVLVLLPVLVEVLGGNSVLFINVVFMLSFLCGKYKYKSIISILLKVNVSMLVTI